MGKRVVVVPPDGLWADEFDRISDEISAAFGSNLVQLHHVGSTSVPGIWAKPVIDMVAEVREIDLVDSCNPALEALGFTARGEFGIPGRRYFFRNDSSGVRLHQVHTFQSGSPGVMRHLAFRDFLIAHPDIAHEYSEMKRRLAQQHPEDIEAYMDGKDGFIKEVEAKAVDWYSEMQSAE